MMLRWLYYALPLEFRLYWEGWHPKYGTELLTDRTRAEYEALKAERRR